MNNFGTGIWDLILSILVTFHLIAEFVHYIHEYLTARREKAYLKDIYEHRKSSTKTEKLIKIQEGIKLILEHLKMEKK